MPSIVHLHFDKQSFILLLPRKKNKGTELVILLAAKLDFPPEKAV